MSEPENIQSSEEEQTAYIDDEDDSSENAVIQPEKECDEDAEKKATRTESFRIMAEVGNFGLFLVIAVVFCYAIGKWMDGVFGTKPIFMVFWIVCGVAASILELRKSLIKASKLADNDTKEDDTKNA